MSNLFDMGELLNNSFRAKILGLHVHLPRGTTCPLYESVPHASLHISIFPLSDVSTQTWKTMQVSPLVLLLLLFFSLAVLAQGTILPPRPPSPLAISRAAIPPNINLSDVINVSPASSVSHGAEDWSIVSARHQLICNADGLTFNLATLCDIFCNCHRLEWLQCQKNSMVCKQGCRCIARQWLAPSTVAGSALGGSKVFPGSGQSEPEVDYAKKRPGYIGSDPQPLRKKHGSSGMGAMADL